MMSTFLLKERSIWRSYSSNYWKYDSNSCGLVEQTSQPEDQNHIYGRNQRTLLGILLKLGSCKWESTISYFKLWSKFFKLAFGECLCHDICNLVFWIAMLQTDFFWFFSFSNSIIIHFNVLSPSMILFYSNSWLVLYAPK